MSVLQFQPKEPMVWSCGCGNQSFFISSVGEVECVVCSTFQDTEVQAVVPRKSVKVISDEQRNQWEQIAETLMKEDV